MSIGLSKSGQKSLSIGSVVLSERKLPVKKLAAVVIIVVIVAAGALGYYYQTLQKPAVPKIVTYATLSEMVTLDPSTEFSNSIMVLSTSTNL